MSRVAAEVEHRSTTVREAVVYPHCIESLDRSLRLHDLLQSMVSKLFQNLQGSVNINKSHFIGVQPVAIIHDDHGVQLRIGLTGLEYSEV